jgi:uncharacterized protein (DUF362 family)
MPYTRRSFLRAAATLAIVSAAGCGATPAPTPTPQPSPTTAPSATPVIAPPTAPATAAPVVVRTATATAAPPTAVPTTAQATATVARQATPPPSAGQSYMAVARGDSPEKITRAAIASLGGISRFVKPGNDVIIKPNICNASRGFEYASTTNPEVIGTLVTLCKEAGAKRIRVMDSPFEGTDGQAYVVSGIADAVKRAGGEMESMARMKFQDTAIPNGKDITKWPIYQDALKADVLIDVPIAKNHNMARLTLGMKNLMGLILDRGQIHYNMGQRLTDLASVLKPSLTVVDAVRILTQGGPTGGNLSWVKKMDTVIASHDIVAADAYGATLFGMKGADLDYVKAAAAAGLGRMDIDKLQIDRISL